VGLQIGGWRKAKRDRSGEYRISSGHTVFQNEINEEEAREIRKLKDECIETSQGIGGLSGVIAVPLWFVIWILFNNIFSDSQNCPTCHFALNNVSIANKFQTDKLAAAFIALGVAVLIPLVILSVLALPTYVAYFKKVFSRRNKYRVNKLFAFTNIFTGILGTISGLLYGLVVTIGMAVFIIGTAIFAVLSVMLIPILVAAAAMGALFIAAG
jgi:hypothetical protein